MPVADADPYRFQLTSIFKQAHWRRSPGACFFLSLLVILYATVLLKLFIPAWGRRGMEQFHLTVESFPQWAALQPIPAMYNYANEIWIGDRPRKSVAGHPTAEEYKEYHTWVNHYPLRVVSFNWTRDVIVGEPGYKYVTLRSHYRGSVVETGYFLRVADGQIYMERIY